MRNALLALPPCTLLLTSMIPVPATVAEAGSWTGTGTLGEWCAKDIPMAGWGSVDIEAHGG